MIDQRDQNVSELRRSTKVGLDQFNRFSLQPRDICFESNGNRNNQKHSERTKRMAFGQRGREVQSKESSIEEKKAVKDPCGSVRSKDTVTLTRYHRRKRNWREAEIS